MDRSPSGRQVELHWEDQRATVVEVGGGIREYEVEGRAVLEPYPADAMCDGAHGAPLIPWPNRVGDGRYRFDGVEHQLDLSEPDKRNAIHGLLRWRPWTVRHRTAHTATMGTTLFPMQGYPFLLDVEIAYALDRDGLRVVTTARNLGTGPCPYGAGQHAYLSPGTGLIDDCTLQFAATTRITTDDEQQLPTGTEPVAGTGYDFAAAVPLGARKVDTAFTDLTRDADGRARARLTGTDGRTAELWVDESYGFFQLFTGDTLAPDRQRRGLGAEPMTCPADAFRSGDGLLRIDPGESVTTTWGARLT